MHYVNSYMPIENLLLHTATTFTLSIWVRFFSLSTINTIFDCDANEIMSLSTDTNGGLVFQTRLNQRVVALNAITDSLWHNVIITFDIIAQRYTKSIYVDGKLKATMSNHQTLPTLGRKQRYCNIGAMTANTLVFGAPPLLANRLTGDVATVNLWFSVLTDDQILCHYTSSKKQLF
jgi:hypothetical protein